MEFKEYQKWCQTTAIYPDEVKVIYPIIGLANESGEVLGKLKKVLREDRTLEEAEEDIISELGDCFWYLAQCCNDLEITLEDLAAANYLKLSKRKAKGTLRGDGDNR